MKWLARALGAVLALALVLLGLGYWGATRPPVVVQATYHLSGLAPGTSLKVLLFSDTHYGRPEMTEARLDDIMDQANALEPDLILIGGDYSGGKLIGLEPIPHMEPAVRPFARLKAPLGVFAVMGNHESPLWAPKVFARQGTPKLLVNESVDVGPVVVAGIRSVSLGADVAGTLSRIAPGSKPILMVWHESDGLFYNRRPSSRSLLVLSGHTHGGQVRLPFVGSAAELFKGPNMCRRGPCTINGWPLYVTSGVGISWLPVRIGVPPELVLLSIMPCEAGSKCPRVSHPKS